MISDEHQAILIHIPKTGGTSLRKILKGNQQNHWSPELCREAFGARWDRYLKIAVVRHPLDRLVSIFSFYKYGNEPTNESFKRTLEDYSFGDFVRMFTGPTPMKWLSGTFTHPERRYQRHWVTLDGKSCVDRLLRFETLERDTRALCADLGIDLDGMPHERPSQRRGHWRDMYDEETLGLAADWFRTDLDFFGYDV